MHRPALISCAMCGCEKTTDGFCSSECEELYQETHSSALIAAGISSERWSYTSRCAVSATLIGDSVEDADKYKKSIESLEQIKKRLNDLYKELPKNGAATSTAMSEWAAKFERTMRSLDVVFSSDFAQVLTEHLIEFDKIHGSSPSSPSSDALKRLLGELARAIPMERISEAQRKTLKALLEKQAPKTKERLILTLDGGGMRGVITLTILIELLRLVREKSGKANATITDCFDMIIGTSTGGLIAMMITILGLSLEEVFGMYASLGGRIFGESAKVHDLTMSLLIRYSDKTMMRILLDLFGTKRFDDEDVRFKGDLAKGANGVRLAVTAIDISVEPSVGCLLRNYQPPTSEASIPGTNKCFAAEAGRGTASPATYTHPLSRNRAPVHTAISSITRHQSSFYEVTDSGRYYENIDMIIDSASSEAERTRLLKLLRDDGFMNEATLTDGGGFANNPSEVAIQEAIEVYAGENVIPIVVNVGTGKSPSKKSEIWSSTGIKDPAARGLLLGEYNMRKVLSATINGSLVSPATDTERIAKRVAFLYGQFAFIRRLNPPLREPFELDDFSKESAVKMVEDTKAWIASKDGQQLLEEISEKIVASSEKIRAL
jgi:hypothetical protein